MWRKFQIAFRSPTPAKLIQFAFHDCAKYEGSGGGCDGCLNWAGMGFESEMFNGHPGNKEKIQGKFPKPTHESNNKLQITARSLELIYTLTDWPPGSKLLTQSLFESGKSRADLWQFAGNIGLEQAINQTHTNCQHMHKLNSLESHLAAIDGADKCTMKLHKRIPFRTGRVDCVPDEDKKWTPFPFEATKKEKHSNTWGTGTQVVKDLKNDFGLTARESISLMAVHGLSAFTKHWELGTQYKWAGGLKDDWRYHKTKNITIMRKIIQN